MRLQEIATEGKEKRERLDAEFKAEGGHHHPCICGAQVRCRTTPEMEQGEIRFGHSTMCYRCRKGDDDISGHRPGELLI